MGSLVGFMVDRHDISFVSIVLHFVTNRLLFAKKLEGKIVNIGKKRVILGVSLNYYFYMYPIEI